jgi:hypothetical protein
MLLQEQEQVGQATAIISPCKESRVKKQWKEKQVVIMFTDPHTAAH